MFSFWRSVFFLSLGSGFTMVLACKTSYGTFPCKTKRRGVFPAPLRGKKACSRTGANVRDDFAPCNMWAKLVLAQFRTHTHETVKHNKHKSRQANGIDPRENKCNMKEGTTASKTRLDMQDETHQKHIFR